VVARLSAASKAQKGEELELWLDARTLHLFDPDTGDRLSRGPAEEASRPEEGPRPAAPPEAAAAPEAAASPPEAASPEAAAPPSQPAGAPNG